MTFPSLSLDHGATASGWPPDPLTCPDYYRGITERRVFAYLVDLCVLGLILVGLFMLLMVLTVVSFHFLPLFYLMVFPLPLAIVYHSLWLSGSGHATVGMRVFGLQAYRLDGGEPVPLQAFVHTCFFYGTIGFGGGLLLLIALFNPRRRTLHDFIAGILVVRKIRS